MIKNLPFDFGAFEAELRFGGVWNQVTASVGDAYLSFIRKTFDRIAKPKIINVVSKELNYK